MQELDNNIPREVRAYHEAGHAVAAHVLGLKITAVDIRVNQEYGGNFDVVRPAGSEDPNVWRYHRLRKFTEKFDMMLMAGRPASEMVANMTTEQLKCTAASDFKMLREDAGASFPVSTADAWLVETMRGHGEDKYRVFVDGKHAHLKIAYEEWICERARALVRFPAHQYAIEVLAAALLEQEALSGKEAHRIIRQALREYKQHHGKP